jgi:hypothetical protein
MFLTPANSENCPGVYDQKILLMDEELLEGEM